ncbi:MAG: protein translocase subunit SecD [Candidatus Colwellbacteria bacterium]|nr:protein translocase subunit SecD [Candidatus Colwellbacteria bacterium]
MNSETTTRKKAVLAITSIAIISIAAAAFVLPEPGTTLVGRWKSPDLFINRLLPWRLGLDLVGGTALVYDIDLTNVSASDYDSVTEGIVNVIEGRVNAYGVSEPKIRLIAKEKHRELIVELAGVKDLGSAVKEIGDTPVLEFKEGCAFSAAEDGTELVSGCKPAELSGRHVKGASLEANTNDPLNPAAVGLEFTKDGTKLFEEVTGRNVGKPLTVFLDNKVLTAPIVREKIAGGSAQISGPGITRDEAIRLASRFNAGALSAPIRLVNERTVNASAAADSLARMLAAGLVGTALVALFMLVYYRLLGSVAVLALAIYVLLTLGVFKLFPGLTMTLAGISGFILSIGMAVDANILTFERTLEERRHGARWSEALENGFRRAWPSIRDSNISTIITALILYSFTSSFVRGFALTLALGVLISMFSAITTTRLALRAFVKHS